MKYHSKTSKKLSYTFLKANKYYFIYAIGETPTSYTFSGSLLFGDYSGAFAPGLRAGGPSPVSIKYRDSVVCEGAWSTDKCTVPPFITSC